MGVVTIAAVRDAAYYESYAAVADVEPRWLGSAATLDLGLTRPPVVSELGPDGRRVREGDVVRLLDGRHPATGAALLGHHQANRRAGFDVTFSPPKSVSVLEMAARLAGDRATSDAVWDAHRAAVEATFAWMEDNLFVARRGHAGRDGTVKARVAAVAFDHATSREDDPQIHSHVVLPNVGWGEDGRVTSLWGDAFWQGKHSREHIVRSLSGIYGAALRQELTSRLGVAWTEPKGRDRHREVAGIPRRVRDEFSRRRRQVTAHLAAAGVGDGGKARQAAQLSTRTAKSERPAAELAAEWSERLARLRVQPQRLLRQVEKHARARRAKEASEPPMPDMSAVLATLHGPGGKPTWTRHDLLGALAAASPNGALPSQLEQWADAILGSGAVVEVSTPLTAEAADLAAHGPRGAARYASRAMWEAEAQVVRIVASTKRSGVAPEIVERIVAASTLDDEQAAMVRRITSDGFVHVVAASAGSGKTFALGQALKVWQRAGKDVIGIGPSWRAANELADVGFESSWAYDALVSPAGPGLGAIPRGGVVVIDESSMLPTRALVALLETAHERGAQVVLVGDPRQLSSVEAGGLYAMIGSQLGAVHLTENRRQAADWQVQALRDIREGRSDRAVEALARHGDVVLATDEASAVGHLLTDWWEARRAGTEVAILASTRSGADSLNALAHARLAAAGVLGGKSVTLEESPKHDGMPERELRPGDEIRFRKRRYFAGKLSVANGDTATVESVSPTHIELRLKSGHVVRSTTSWATDNIDYGYAGTIHASQGRTVGTARSKRERGGAVRRGECFILAADALALEGAYVAASRAVDRTRLYLSPGDPSEHDSHLYDREGRPLDPPPADPLARAAASWSRPDSDEAATAEAARAAEIAGLAALDRAELEAEREAVADTIAATVAGKTDADLVSARARLEVLDAALEARRRAEVADLALAATAGEGAGWVTSVLGPVPEDRPGQLRWREGAGALVDAKHWVAQARSTSRSDYVQALASPEKVASDLAALAKHDDRRRLEALADEAAVTALRQALVERFDGNDRWAAAASTPASDRLLMAAAWLGDLSLDGVSKEAERLEGVGASPEAALATALQRATSASVTRRTERGEPVPLAVAAAAEVGVTLPAGRALTEAAEIGAELMAREPEPEVPAPPSPRAPAGASGVSRAPAGAPEETVTVTPEVPGPYVGGAAQQGGNQQWQKTL